MADILETTLKFIFLNENCCISTKYSLEVVPTGLNASLMEQSMGIYRTPHE